MFDRIYTIYKATNYLSGKSYIGFASNWPNRRKEHERDSHRYKHVFARAMVKYGPEAFHWEVLYQSKDGEHTHKVMEAFFIQEHNTQIPYGYNITKGGDGFVGVQRWEEWNQNISKTKKSQPLSEEHKAALKKTYEDGTRRTNYEQSSKTLSETWKRVGHPRQGTKHTEESKLKMSVSRKGKKTNLSEEGRERKRKAVSRQITIEGRNFESVNQAVRELDIHKHQVLMVERGCNSVEHYQKLNESKAKKLLVTP